MGPVVLKHKQVVLALVALLVVPLLPQVLHDTPDVLRVSPVHLLVEGVGHCHPHLIFLLCPIGEAGPELT